MRLAIIALLFNGLGALAAKPTQSPFFTRVFRAHLPLTAAVEDENKQQQFNIGVIQVRLKHWTTIATPMRPPPLIIGEEFHSPFRRNIFSPLDSFKYWTDIRANNVKSTSAGRQERDYHDDNASLDAVDSWRGRYYSRHSVRSPPSLSGEESIEISERRDVSAILRRQNHATRRQQNYAPSSESTNADASERAIEHGDTFVEIFDALWRRLDLLNSPLGYMLIVVGFMLVALLLIIYAVLTVTLNRRKRQQALEKYEALQLANANVAGVNEDNDEENGNGQPVVRYQRNAESNSHRMRQRENSLTYKQPMPPPRRYVSVGSANNSRSQTPKNSLNSLQRHQIEHYAPVSMTSQRGYAGTISDAGGGTASGGESELERLYRSISPFKRQQPLYYRNHAPSLTSEDSVSLMRRVSTAQQRASDDERASITVGAGRRRRRNTERKRREQQSQRMTAPPILPFGHPPPPPPPKIPPPPIPPH